MSGGAVVIPEELRAHMEIVLAASLVAATELLVARGMDRAEVARWCAEAASAPGRRMPALLAFAARVIPEATFWAAWRDEELLADLTELLDPETIGTRFWSQVRRENLGVHRFVGRLMFGVGRR